MRDEGSTDETPVPRSSWDRESWDMVLRGDPNGWMRRQGQLVDAEEIDGAVEDLVRRRGTRGSPETIDAYAHFTYCRKTCSFCMYWHQVPSRLGQYDEYADHLASLCHRFGSLTGPIDVNNAYFGGGTPSAMPLVGLDHFLRAFGKSFRVDREFTTEAHPNTLDEDKASAFLAAGVNRFSMGLQSLDPLVLEGITRNNRPLEEVAALVRMAQGGQAMVNLDLCLGLPRQTLPSLRSDLRDVLGLGPDAITVYRYHAVPSLPTPAPEGMNYDALFVDALRSDIGRAGYDLRYEAKKFTAKILARDPASRKRLRAIKTGARSQHGRRTLGNYGYAQFDWRPSSIIGMGPGAFTHLYGRFWVREVTRLEDLGQGGKPVYWGARISLEDEVRMAMLQNLNRNTAVVPEAIEVFSGIDIRERWADLLRELESDGVLRWDRGSGRKANFRLRRGVGDLVLREVSERLAPSIPAPRRLTAEERLRVQPQLVIDPDRGGGGSPRASMVDPWRQLLGVPSVGRRFLAARVELIDDRSVHFACGAAGSTPLRVFVEPAGDGRAFSRSERFALSYGSRPHEPMTEREMRFLEALARRTQELDPRI